MTFETQTLANGRGSEKIRHIDAIIAKTRDRLERATQSERNCTQNIEQLKSSRFLARRVMREEQDALLDLLNVRHRLEIELGLEP